MIAMCRECGVECEGRERCERWEKLRKGLQVHQITLKEYEKFEEEWEEMREIWKEVYRKRELLK